jgi:hypothetical protein
MLRFPLKVRASSHPLEVVTAIEIAMREGDIRHFRITTRASGVPMRRQLALTPRMSSDHDMRIVALSAHSAEVHLGSKIGKVGTSGQRWWWQHRDGEKSSPIADSRGEAAQALASYHCTFKEQPTTVPVRRLLFA